MKTSIYLSIFLSFCLSVSLNAQVNSNKDVEKNEGIKRNAMYNLEEIKVRWKKAALENCPGVPCPPPAPSFTCGTSTINDVDGNAYNTVLIGTQCWIQSNLKVSKYRNGDAIPTGLNDATWSSTNNGAYTIYNNDLTNNAIYGKLYNWHAVIDSRGLCPTGWHVPSDGEWTTLTTYLGGESVAGGKMKSTGTTYWDSPNTGATNESGFSVLPGGYRFNVGSFLNIRIHAFFWSATESDSSNAWFRYLYSSIGNVNRYYYYKLYGFSVRCLRD